MRFTTVLTLFLSSAVYADETFLTPSKADLLILAQDAPYKKHPSYAKTKERLDGKLVQITGDIHIRSGGRLAVADAQAVCWIELKPDNAYEIVIISWGINTEDLQKSILSNSGKKNTTLYGRLKVTEQKNLANEVTTFVTIVGASPKKADAGKEPEKAKEPEKPKKK